MSDSRFASVVFFTFAALFLATAARTVMGGDAGEFMTLAATGGIAHPPGYPLFSLLLQGAGAVLPGPVAWRASAVAAIQGAAALAVLAWALRRRTGSGVAALVAVGLLGLGTTFWRYSTVAEVFAGGALTAALVIAVCSEIDRGWRGPVAAFALGLAVATGIANHHTVVLLAPLAVAMFLRSTWTPEGSAPDVRRFAVAVGVCVAGLAPGFLLYGVLLLPTDGWSWGEVNDLGALASHFLREDYGTFSLGLSGAPVEWWEHPVAFAQRWVREGLLIAPVLALIGFGLRRDLFTAALAASFLLAGPVFLARFNLPPENLGAVVAARFHILPLTIAAFSTGLGAAWVLEKAPPRPASLVAGGWIAAAALLNGPQAEHASWRVLQDYIVGSLQAVPSGSLLVVSGDNFVFGARYAQEVLDVRPDVIVAHAGLLPQPWYRAQVAARPTAAPPRLTDSLPVLDLVRRALPDRPVYLNIGIATRPEVLASGLPVYPESGVLFRVDGGEGAPPPHLLGQQMARATEQLGLLPPAVFDPKARDTWEGWAHRQLAAPWTTLAAAFDAEGNAEAAASCRARAAAWWKD